MKKILKTVWMFLKKNWLTLLAIVGIVCLVVVGYKVMNSLLSNDISITQKLAEEQERHIKDIADLNKISNEQLAKQAALNAQYEQNMNDLRTEFQTGLDEIRRTQRRRQTKLANDPTALGSAITSVFGVPQGGSN